MSCAYFTSTLFSYLCVLLVQIKPIDNDILSTVAFLPRSILTSTKNGYIKLWIRPLALRPRMKHRQPAPDVDVL
jgi:hypothetical protein